MAEYAQQQSTTSASNIIPGSSASTFTVQSSSQLPGSYSDFRQPVTVNYRGQVYTLSNPNQYESFRLQRSAEEQRAASDAQSVARGANYKSPTLVTAPRSTTPGSSDQSYTTKEVNFIGGSYVPEGRQVYSSPLASLSEASGKPFTAVVQERASVSTPVFVNNPPASGIGQALANKGFGTGTPNGFLTPPNQSNFSTLTGRNIYVPPNLSMLNGNLSANTNGGRASFPTPSITVSLPEENPRLQALRQMSNEVGSYQQGVAQRQENTDIFFSKLTFGEGTPFEQRSIPGKIGQTAFRTTAALASFGATEAGPMIDYGVLTGKKILLYANALVIPETRGPAIKELKSTLPVIPETLSNPYVLVPAVAAAGVYGGSLMSGAKNPKSITLEPLSGSASRPIISENAMAGSQIVKSIGTLNYKYGPLGMFSRTDTVPVESNVLFTAQRIPQTNIFGVRVESQSLVPTPKGNVFIPEDFAGIFNTNTKFLSILSPEGKMLFSQTGKSIPVMYDTVSSIEQNPSRFITLQKNPSNIPLVTGKGVSSTLSEPMQFSKVPYRGIDGINIFGQPQEFTTIPSNTLTRNIPATGADTELFKGGFQNLERVGLYKNQPIIQNDPISDRVSSAAKDFLANRKGTIGQESITIPQQSQSRLPQESILKPPTQFDLTPLPISREFPTSPRIIIFPLSGIQQDNMRTPFSTPQRNTDILNQQANGLNPQRPKRPTMPDTLPKTLPDQLPRQKPSFMPSTTPQQTPSLFQAPRSVLSPSAPSPPSFPPVTPPTLPTPNPNIPPLRFTIPYFGRGQSSSLSPGKFRPSFKYVPSLTAGYYHITGPKPKGFLTGVSIRPIPEQMKRRKIKLPRR